MATTTTTFVNCLRIILMSTGVVFIATFLTPHIFNFTASQLSVLWSSLRSWLRPPYLYFLINAIIITIAASSRLRHHHHKHPDANQDLRHVPHHIHRSSVGAAENYTYTAPTETASFSAPVLELGRAGLIYASYDAVSGSDETATFGGRKSGVVEVKEVEKAVGVKDDEIKRVGNENFVPPGDGGSRESKTVVLRSTTKKKPPPPPQPAPLARQGTLEIVSSFFESQIEKLPSPSIRFGHQRKPTRTVPEGGRALGVAKPKLNDTLENTWKAITEGPRVPLVRHLKKSDTWENHSRQATSSDPPPSLVKKSETFMERSNHSPATATGLEKEASLSQDELNNRVEAFINKFNEDMRLQRQESIQQLMEMINRAAY